MALANSNRNLDHQRHHRNHPWLERSEPYMRSLLVKVLQTADMKVHLADAKHALNELQRVVADVTDSKHLLRQSFAPLD